MIMSKVKVQKPGSAPVTAKAGKSPEKNIYRRQEKHWKKPKFPQKKPPPKDQGKDAFSLPPTDPQQFSANWKSLLEVLKTSPPEESRPTKTQQKKHSSHKMDVQGKPAKDISGGESGGRARLDAGKVIKNKTVPGKVVSKGSQMNGKGPSASETEQNPKATKKRKQANEKANSEQAAKRKKVETETKPTEADIWFDDVDPDDVEATMGTEAADIMRRKQGLRKSEPDDTESALVKEKAFEGLTRAVAMDCEMVGVGPDGEDSIVARVSLVNHFGKCIYDKHVKPTEKVTDYRTAVSGIRPEDIKDGEDVHTVQREVAEILQGRILVGHAIHNDLKILLLDHPKKKIRDTQKYKPFKRAVKSGRPSLKLLCRDILNVNVQQGEHSSVQDAQATMRLYTMAKKQWEAEIKASHSNRDSATKSVRKPKTPAKK